MVSSSPSRTWRFALPVASLAVAGAMVAGCSSSATSGSATSGSATSAGSDGNAVQLQNQYEKVVKDVLPSVVEISAGSSIGSGVVYNDKGDIVTNAHVVGNEKTVQVKDSAGKVRDATVVGDFPSDDLAVVRVTGGSLKPAKWANSSNTQPGEIVLALGSPLGLSESVTQGIVSATGRNVGSSGGPSIRDAIQTSAAINPGNSGGALVNLEDQVVGIPALGLTLPDEGGAAQGIGFAIPSNTVKSVVGR